MFIINPDLYSSPVFRIGPFRTIDISINNSLSMDNTIDDYFNKRFKDKKYSYHMNGRTAIYEALYYYKLKKEDVVSIVTTSNNFYISGCVTSEIEKFCKWDREITDKTTVIFVNHEFGLPYENLRELKKYNLPIIEDCAHSFYSSDKEQSIGNIGDFVIYSFPKMFPIQIGGLLVSNIDTNISTSVNNETLVYIQKVLSHYIIKRESVIQKRIEIYKKFIDEFKVFGFTERFPLQIGFVPGVFMFNVNNEEINLPDMKNYLWRQGIHCSVFYGERAFYIPNHQYLTNEDILYFKEVIKSFLSS